MWLATVKAYLKVLWWPNVTGPRRWNKECLDILCFTVFNQLAAFHDVVK